MKTLNSRQMAAVKRTAMSIKPLLKSKNRLEEKMRAIATQIVDINKQVDSWEEPIKSMYGITSSQIIELGGNIPEESDRAVAESDTQIVEESNNTDIEL